MNTPVEGFQLAINLALFLLFWRLCWKRYSIDVARQNLFSIRNDLFDLAANPNSSLEFGSKEYVLLRRWIHTSIRFTDRFEGIHLLLSLLIEPAVKIEDGPETAINAVQDKELRSSLLAIKSRCAHEVVFHLLRTSPLFWLTTLGLVLCQLIKVSHGTLEHWSKVTVPSVVKVLDFEYIEEAEAPPAIA